jgi:triosephosphate isomerase
LQLQPHVTFGIDTGAATKLKLLDDCCAVCPDVYRMKGISSRANGVLFAVYAGQGEFYGRGAFTGQQGFQLLVDLGVL